MNERANERVNGWASKRYEKEGRGDEKKKKKSKERDRESMAVIEEGGEEGGIFIVVTVAYNKPFAAV